MRTLRQAIIQRKPWNLEGTKGNQIILKGKGDGEGVGVGRGEISKNKGTEKEPEKERDQSL